jgi:parvulin-like peptidyl-prolyl isomerase
MTEAQKKEKEKLAKDIKAQIDKGDLEFSKAVQQYTEDKNALVSGGDMMLIKGIAPKEIDQAAFSLPVGKVSSPIKSELGWHIIKVKEKRAKQDVTYDMVAQQLAQYLAQQRIEMAMAEYVNGLADKADIKVTKKFEVDAVIEKAAAERAAQEAKKEAEKATK